MVGNGVSGGICRAIYRYAKANNKYIKDYDKNIESSNVKYWDVNNLYSWAISKQFVRRKRLPVNDFKRTEDISQFDKSFVKSYNEKSNERYFLEVDVEYLGNLPNFHTDLPLFPERIKI